MMCKMDQPYISAIISSDKRKSDVYNNIMEKNKLFWRKFDDNHILTWLHNFSDNSDKDENIYLALLLADKVMFYSEDKIRSLWPWLLNNQFKRVISELYFSDQTISQINQSFQQFIESRCLFAPFGTAGDSAHTMYYNFSHSIDNRRIKKIDLSYLVANFDELIGKGEYKNVDTIILLDDFIGSGTQATNFWDKQKFLGKTLKNIHKTHPQIKFYFFALCGMKEGIDKIRALLHITVIVGEELDDRFKCFSDCSQIFENPKDRKKVKFLMKNRGKLLYSHPLGYKNSQLAIAFDHNTPNNTLPVIWRKKKDGSWHPLFERYGEEEE